MVLQSFTQFHGITSIWTNAMKKRSLVQCYMAEQMSFDQFFKATKKKTSENFSYSQDQIKNYQKRKRENLEQNKSDFELCLLKVSI